MVYITLLILVAAKLLPNSGKATPDWDLQNWMDFYPIIIELLCLKIQATKTDFVNFFNFFNNEISLLRESKRFKCNEINIDRKSGLSAIGDTFNCPHTIEMLHRHLEQQISTFVYNEEIEFNCRELFPNHPGI